MAGKCTEKEQSILQLLFCSHPENGSSTFFPKRQKNLLSRKMRKSESYYLTKLHFSIFSICHTNKQTNQHRIFSTLYSFKGDPPLYEIKALEGLFETASSNMLIMHFKMCTKRYISNEILKVFKSKSGAAI